MISIKETFRRDLPLVVRSKNLSKIEKENNELKVEVMCLRKEKNLKDKEIMKLLNEN